jgi:hypothetical protein
VQKGKEGKRKKKAKVSGNQIYNEPGKNSKSHVASRLEK